MVMEESKQGRKKVLAIVLIVAIFLVAGALVSWRCTKQKLGGILPFAEEPSPTPSLVPSPTPTAILERKNLSIQILNGTGVVGAAGEGRDLLEALGYKEVETGNADDYDVEMTKISLKKGKENYFVLLKEDLEKNYEVSGRASVLDEDEEFGAVVILGPSL